MKLFLIPFFIGVFAGIIDILPMLKNKLDKYSICSAFVYHLIMPIVLFNIQLNIPWFFAGAVIYLITSIPIVILVAKEDKKAVPIIIITSIIIGTIVSALLHYVLG